MSEVALTARLNCAIAKNEGTNVKIMQSHAPETPHIPKILLCMFGLVAFVGLLQLKGNFQRLLSAIAIASVAAIMVMTQSLPTLSYPLIIASPGWPAFTLPKDKD